MQLTLNMKMTVYFPVIAGSMTCYSISPDRNYNVSAISDTER